MGAAHLGELYGLVDEADSRAALDAAWDTGVRYFDTAPWYGRGLSEHRLGGFLRTRKRADFLITTKVGRTLHRPADPRSFSREPWAGGLNFEVRHDYSYDGIMRAYEQSLQRLGLDTVDALVIHDLDTMFLAQDEMERHFATMRDSGFRALDELKRAGDIKAIGVGVNYNDGSFTDLVGTFAVDFALVAMPYTLLDQASLHIGMDLCVKRGVSVIVGAPFASGILATGSGSNAKYGYANASPEVQARVRAIEAACMEYGIGLRAAALQFPLAHPAVVSVIPGAIDAAQIEQNVSALAEPIPLAFWEALKASGAIVADAPVPEV
jgi:D-threo-aldose 1-dehydrogenase